MRSLAQLAGQELGWIQPAARTREHELRADEMLWRRCDFGTDHWPMPRLTASTGPSSEVDSGGGTLELADGRTLGLGSANFCQSEWVWQEKDQPLIRFKGRHGIVKAKGAVKIQPVAVSLPMLPMLVLLGWYLILLLAEDAAAASSATTVAVTTTT